MAIAALNLDLERLSRWFLNNHLSLNLQKSTAICFTNRNGTINTSNLTINGQIITLSPSVKLLGIHLDSALSWITHVEFLQSALSKQVYLLSTFKCCLPVHCLKQLYFAHFHSRLTYGLLLFGSANKSTLKPLIILQKKAIRATMRASFNAHSLPLLKSLNTLTLEDLYKQQNLIFMHRFVNNLLPLHLRDFFISPLLRVRPSSERLGMMVDIVRYNKQKPWTHISIGGLPFSIFCPGVSGPNLDVVILFLSLGEIVSWDTHRPRVAWWCRVVGWVSRLCGVMGVFVFVLFHSSVHVYICNSSM